MLDVHNSRQRHLNIYITLHNPEFPPGYGGHPFLEEHFPDLLGSALYLGGVESVDLEYQRNNAINYYRQLGWGEDQAEYAATALVCVMDSHVDVVCNHPLNLDALNCLGSGMDYSDFNDFINVDLLLKSEQYIVYKAEIYVSQPTDHTESRATID